MECLSVAMVAMLKGDLLESDFSMCLGLLMSYKEPDDIMPLLTQAKLIRKNLLEGAPYQRQPSPEPQQLEDSDEEVNNGTSLQ